MIRMGYIYALCAVNLLSKFSIVKPVCYDHVSKEWGSRMDETQIVIRKSHILQFK